MQLRPCPTVSTTPLHLCPYVTFEEIISSSVMMTSVIGGCLHLSSVMMALQAVIQKWKYKLMDSPAHMTLRIFGILCGQKFKVMDAPASTPLRNFAQLLTRSPQGDVHTCPPPHKNPCQGPLPGGASQRMPIPFSALFQASAV